MSDYIDHFIDEQGCQIDIIAVDHDDYVGLNSDRKLRAEQQPVISYLTELPSTQGNSNLFSDIAHYMFDED